MCEHWRKEFPRSAELSVEQWKNALGSLRRFLGHYLIAFLGGEPFIKPGFLDILEFCRERDIDYSTITNGSLLLRGDTIPRLVRAAPVHLNVSVDGATADVHDRSRGVTGSLQTIERAIQAIRREQERTGRRFPIRIKPTVHLWNFHSMPSMVEWVQRVGADTVDFEPVRHWTPEVDRDLWIGPDQINQLREMVKELVGQKRDGAPIETSESRLMRMPDHFATGVVEPEVTPCRVGLRRFAIAPNGDVTTCWFFDPIGNVARQNARDIWLGAVARLRREETVACKRACAYSCMAQKPFKNLVERGRLLIAAGRRRTTVQGMPIR
jgi:radical SAM protein with 4Fe4S-binding SPASM domain